METRVNNNVVKARIEFKFEDLHVSIPHVDSNTKQDHVIHTEQHPAYLLIGFNRWFRNSENIQIPLNKQSLKDMESFTFVLEGELPSSDQKEMKRYFLGSIIASLMVNVKSKWNRITPQRQSKSHVAFLDEIIQQKHSHYTVKMTNKFIPENVFCSFTIRIVSCNIEVVEAISPYMIEPKQCMQNRQDNIENLKCEMSNWCKYAVETEKLFRYFAPGTLKTQIYMYPSYFGPQPTHNYLNFRFSRSNEEWWIYTFETIMLRVKTAQSLSLHTDSIKLFWSFDVWIQMAILFFMCMSVSNGLTYIPDGILLADGILRDEYGSWNIDDWSENPNEGGDDCDGLAKMIAFLLAMFQKYAGKFNHPVLEELRKRLQRYICFLSFALINRAGSPNSEELTPHLTTVSMLKAHAFNAIDLSVSSQIYDSFEFDELKVKFEKLVEYEQAMGNCDMYVMNGTRKDHLPPVIFGEGTQILYTYPTDVHSYISEAIEKWINYDDFTLHQTYGMKHDIYQCTESPFIDRFLLMFSEFFTKHPKFPCNISTLHCSTMLNGEVTFEKGVKASEVFDGNSLVLFPQTRLRDLEHSNELLDCLSYDYFPFCPLERVKDPIIKAPALFSLEPSRCSSRNSKQTQMITLPNIWPPHLPSLPDIIPPKGDTKTLLCSWIPSGNYHTVARSLGKNVIVGRVYVELLPHVTGFIIWFKPEKRSIV